MTPQDILKRAIQLHHDAMKTGGLEREYRVAYVNTETNERYTLDIVFDGDNIEMHVSDEPSELELGLEAG